MEMFYLLDADDGAAGATLGRVMGVGYSSLVAAMAACTARIQRDVRRGLSPKLPQIVEADDLFGDGHEVEAAKALRLFTHRGIALSLPTSK
jgi:hypothetical protein